MMSKVAQLTHSSASTRVRAVGPVDEHCLNHASHNCKKSGPVSTNLKDQVETSDPTRIRLTSIDFCRNIGVSAEI